MKKCIAWLERSHFFLLCNGCPWSWDFPLSWLGWDVAIYWSFILIITTCQLYSILFPHWSNFLETKIHKFKCSFFPASLIYFIKEIKLLMHIINYQEGFGCILYSWWYFGPLHEKSTWVIDNTFKRSCLDFDQDQEYGYLLLTMTKERSLGTCPIH